MVSAGFLCTSEVIVDNIVLVDDELSVISMFLSFVLWRFEIETGNLRRLVIMSGNVLFYSPSF